MSSARIDVAAEMVAFLSPIPNGEQLAKVLRERDRLNSRAYDDATSTARFVASDGRMVKCFSVTGVTIDQAEMIAAASLSSGTGDELEFRQTVEQALGPTFDPAD